MHPILFKIGFLTVYSYGFMLALAFLLGLIVATRLAKKEGIEEDKILDMAIFVIIAAIVGARVFYVIQFFPEFKNNLLEIFAINHGGLVFYGGLFLSILVLFWRIKIHKLNILKVFDIATPSAALGYSVARIGCFLNGCCYGIQTNFPFAVHFPHLLGYRHPTQIYSSITMFFVFLFLMYLWNKKRYNGQIFLNGLLLYSIYRFLIEFIREGPRYIFYLTISQILSIFVFCSVVFFLLKYRKL